MKRTPLKRKPIKKKPIDPKILHRNLEQLQDDIAFYEAIWNKRPHRCEVCGKGLGNVINKMYMDHLLPKSQYPQFRYDERNIGLVCPECHEVRTNYKPHDKHRELIDEARKQLLNENKK